MLYNIIKRRALGRAQSHLGRAQSHLGGHNLTWGRAQSHLGAPRPRVGICLPRLDALASKYKTRPTLIIVLYCQVGASSPNLTMPTRGRVAPR